MLNSVLFESCPIWVGLMETKFFEPGEKAAKYPCTAKNCYYGFGLFLGNILYLSEVLGLFLQCGHSRLYNNRKLPKTAGIGGNFDVVTADFECICGWNSRYSVSRRLRSVRYPSREGDSLLSQEAG